jgi:hypothetical protein
VLHLPDKSLTILRCAAASGKGRVRASFFPRSVHEFPPAAAPVLFAVASVRAEDEIGCVEKFALAPDRAAVLGQLVPGTEDYYYYHALHYQHTRQAGKLKETLAQWAKRFPESDQRKIIENREALLTYDTNPQATLKFLRERLGLEFNHERETREAAPDLADNARCEADCALRISGDGARR